MLNVKLTATIKSVDPGIIEVQVRASGIELDRTDLMGWGLRAKDKKLAERLVAAVEAGAVFDITEVRMDTGGKTYLHATSKVCGRTMNADLKRLGY